MLDFDYFWFCSRFCFFFSKYRKAVLRNIKMNESPNKREKIPQAESTMPYIGTKKKPRIDMKDPI